jgi:hypothetical protein
VAEQLLNGQSIVIPKKLMKDIMFGLTELEGFIKEDIQVHEYGDKIKNHVTLTLKKYVK